MRVHILQHAPFEDVGSMAQWFKHHQAVVNYTRFFENASLPPLDNLDLIVSMGGPMSANDESDFPWLLFEKQFIRGAIDKGIPVLGVCLGAQIIANAMGARVYPNSQKEIGWFPIEPVQNPGDSFRFPSKTFVFHWHGETFDLPAGSIRLARSAVCENQAFQIGRNVIGLQFHLEVIPQSVAAFLENCSNDLAQGPYVQTEGELRKTADSTYQSVNTLMTDVLSYLTRT